MADHVYDVIVLGAGVEGSATAYQLSKQGVDVLMLEQFPLPHTRGSSHGATRITRKAYGKQIYTKMMSYNMDEWRRIGEQVGQTVMETIGYMNIGSMSNKGVQDTVKSLTDNKAKFDVLSPEKFRDRFPHFSFDDDVGAIHDLEGGVLYADKCVLSLQKIFKDNGGVLRDGEKVENILPGETVSVVTAQQTYTGRSIVICCGPWTNKVLKHISLELPLKPLKMSVCYWPEKVPGTYSKGSNIPFSDRTKTTIGYACAGLPSNEYPGLLKFYLDHGPDADPESRDTVDHQWVIDELKTYVRRHLPGLVPEPSIVEPCFYTKTPDEDYILDYHPQWKNIVIGAGFSGHGFKMAPAVGCILADLALGKEPAYDRTTFKISRFDNA